MFLLTSLYIKVAKAIKAHGAIDARTIADLLGVSYEAARSEISEMETRGEVSPSSPAVAVKTRGRPTRVWKLTNRGEHLFPKKYDEVLSELVTAIEQTGVESSIQVLESMVGAKLETFQDQLLPARSTSDKLRVMTSLYDSGDEYMTVSQSGNILSLTESNCPILDVATEHPWICSVSVNTIARATGKSVKRVSKFQDGDGKCVFQLSDQSGPQQFELEDDPVGALDTTENESGETK